MCLQLHPAQVQQWKDVKIMCLFRRLLVFGDGVLEISSGRVVISGGLVVCTGRLIIIISGRLSHCHLDRRPLRPTRGVWGAEAPQEAKNNIKYRPNARYRNRLDRKTRSPVTGSHLIGNPPTSRSAAKQIPIPEAPLEICFAS